MPNSVARLTSFCSSGPSPISQRVTFGNFAIALIKTSKPFRGTNRPLAVTMKLEIVVLSMSLLISLNSTCLEKLEIVTTGFQPKSRQQSAIPGRFPTKHRTC